MNLRLLVAFAAIVSQCQALFTRHTFESNVVEYYGARCLDGSPAGYYLESSRSNNWAIYIEGGGVCFTESTCKAREKTEEGSSKHWPPIRLADETNVISSNATFNPDFASWNHVIIPYCTGDVHVGQRRTANQWGVYFAGHNNIIAIFDHLKNTTNFGSAGQVLLSGGSAGGIGAFVHADMLTSMLPHSTVKASPQGGWFYPNVSFFVPWESNHNANASDVYFDLLMVLFDGYGDESCRNANPHSFSLCGSVGFMYKYITTPLYVAENQFDASQIFVQLGCPTTNTTDAQGFIEYFGRRMRESTSQVLGTNNGLFLPSCLLHTQNLEGVGGTILSGHSYFASLGDWFFGRGQVPHQLVDPCVSSAGLPCNPKCLS